MCTFQIVIYWGNFNEKKFITSCKTFHSYEKNILGQKDL
jgi:hypothetical protein